MPLVAVNLSHAVLKGIRELIESGKYLSLESFIEVASFNQIALEKSGGSDLKSTAEGAAASTSPEQRGSIATRRKKRNKVGGITRQVYLLDQPKPAEGGELVVKPFSKHFPAASTVTPLPILSSDSDGSRIFGQVNRLFPLKLVCRWVMRASHSQDQWPSLSDVGEALADDAARLGSLLEQQDIANGRKRDECLSTGLPRRGNGPSKDRFLSQFVARVTRSGHIFPGAVCQYKLASIQGQSLALSQKGVSFALLENPIVDGRLTSSNTALGSEEIQFLVRHIWEAVPQEQADVQAVLEAVTAGFSTPQSLTSTLRNYLPSEWNLGEVQTHVSGLVARMSELNLLRRRWHGRHVEYEATRMEDLGQPKEKSREAG